MATPTSKLNPAEEDQLFRLLRQLDTAPEASQRATAAAIGISLGGLNGLLRTAVEAGLIKISDRPGPDKRQRFAYSLTSRGATEKVRWHEMYTPELIAEFKHLGYGTATYTVNETARGKELIEMGVESIITDFPGEMIAALK